MSGRVGQALARTMRMNVSTFTGGVTAEWLGAEDWASVTFSGARHRLRLVLEGRGAAGAAADFLALLPDLEFAIRGQIVADVALLSEGRRDDGGYASLELEALTIAED